MSERAPEIIRLKDYRPTPYLIEHVNLSFKLSPAATRVLSELSIKPNPKVRTRGPLRLDGERFKFISISIDGHVLAETHYKRDSQSLTLLKPSKSQFTLTIETECAPIDNTELSGLYMSNGVYCTQCEAEGFRRITYFYDRPDVLATYNVRIEADVSLKVLLSNGNPVAQGNLTGINLHFAEWQDPHPKPCYLFALVAGDLAKVQDNFTTMDGRAVALGIYVEKGKQDRCAWAMQSLKAAMKWDEEAFARAYDLDVFNIVAVSDFNMGAMENKGLNIFNDKYILARPETATDTDFELIEAIIAHEYFHNWTGNRITCRDWFQLCLKEGLTVFRDQEFTADYRSRAVKRIDDVQDLRSRQMPEDLGPLQHAPRPSEYIEINNFYTATVYEKGAEICRMLKTLLGAKNFAKGIQLYFRRHDGKAATVEQFITCFEEASRQNLKQFLRWYEQAGVPVIAIAEKYDVKRSTYSLKLSQSVKTRKGQKAKKPMHMPIQIGLLFGTGKEISKTLELNRASQTFRFEQVAEKPILSFNRNFTAPILRATNPSFADQIYLLRYDGDSFNRWDAGQQLAQHLVVAHYKTGATPKWQSQAQAFADALRAPLFDLSGENALQAKLLEIPELGVFAEVINRNVDAAKLAAARVHLREFLGRTLQDELQRTYSSLASSSAYIPDAKSNGKRALRSALLSLASEAQPPWVESAVRQQFDSRANMTEEFGALRVAAFNGGAFGDELLAEFEKRHAHDPLLMDKWFAVQALAPHSHSVQKVRQLMAHPAFNLKTPNRVYALLRNFIGGNFEGFHDAAGAGYYLASEAIICLDTINPQVASRLATGFRSWRLFDAPRRKHAQAAMTEILRSKTLSRDVGEIISRTMSK